MEHRWGERVPSRLPVRLDLGSLTLVRGRMENVSFSGAFISTGDRVPTSARVHVEFKLPRSRTLQPYRIPAHVVRVTAHGVAVEWSTFAPRAIRMLFASSRARALARPPAHAPAAIQPEDLPTGFSDHRLQSVSREH